MIKLKDILLENPADYVDKDIDALDILYKKKKYDVNEAGDHEGKMAKAQLERSMKYAKMIYKIVDNVGNGGEVLLFDMGKPVKIIDLAQNLLYMFPYKKLSIEIIGLQRGEKLYEELLCNSEEILPTEEKLKIVGKLIGRQKQIHEDDIYQCMIDINEWGKKITLGRIAGLLDCSKRTIQRNMCEELKREKELLNQQI